jgi:hypothetical protein
MRFLVSLHFFCVIVFLTGCFSLRTSFETKEDDESAKRLHHVVLCWLKETGNLEHRKQIIEVTKTFRGIPGVLAARAGSAVQSERSIVDDSFDVGILIVVKDEESLSSYLEHPLHQRAKKDTLLPLVDKILVYDFKE